MTMLLKTETAAGTRKRFEGRVVLVTGAGSGIGKAAAEQLAAEGAALCLAGRSPKILEVADSLRQEKHSVLGVLADTSSEENVRRLFQECSRTFGRLDVLINSAGIGRPGKIDDITAQEWREVIDHNLTNTFLCCREAIAFMKGHGGSIVNVSSLAGRFRSGLGGAHYAASKAGVIGLTRHLAGEVAKYKIRVNAVCPGPTQTPMLVDTAKAVDRSLDAISQAVPLGYISSPEEQARAILFLASDDSSYITGTALDVNGGIF